MAQIRIEEVVDHLDSEFKKALEDLMMQYAPSSRHDRNELFRYFKERVYHHCSVWEDVPDRYIRQ